jgi:hypothetical protein
MRYQTMNKIFYKLTPGESRKIFTFDFFQGVAFADFFYENAQSWHVFKLWLNINDLTLKK